jgi:hypothetical protein
MVISLDGLSQIPNSFNFKDSLKYNHILDSLEKSYVYSDKKLENIAYKLNHYTIQGVDNQIKKQPNCKDILLSFQEIYIDNSKRLLAFDDKYSTPNFKSITGISFDLNDSFLMIEETEGDICIFEVITLYLKIDSDKYEKYIYKGGCNEYKWMKTNNLVNEKHIKLLIEAFEVQKKQNKCDKFSSYKVISYNFSKEIISFILINQFK